MAKWIKYKIKNGLLPAEMPWSEANEEVARRDAHNGEIEITPDDGQPEPEVQPTQEERIAELEAALDMILAGVTE